MFIAAALVSVLLAAALVYAGGRKLTHAEHVVRSYAQVGVPERYLNFLAAVLFAGAAGLLVGLWWRPLGIAAAAGLTAYFLIACGLHVRARDTSNLPVPVTMAGLAIAVLPLHLLTS